MGKVYRSLQQWNRWLMQSEGQAILSAEKKCLVRISTAFVHGKHSLLIGVPEQQVLFNNNQLMHQTLLSPFRQELTSCALVESDPTELPVASGSVDLVLLPHTLEYASRPHHLLAEACRIVRPSGHIIVVGFNPLGILGIKKMFKRELQIPLKTAHFISPHKVKHWLSLADFILIKQEPYLFFSTFYILVAEARVIPCTPIRLRWKQTLPAFQATLSGSSIRNQV